MATQRRYTQRYTQKVRKDLLNVSYRIPPEIDKNIVKLAANEGVSINTMVIKIMTAGLTQYAPNQDLAE